MRVYILVERYLPRRADRPNTTPPTHHHRLDHPIDPGPDPQVYLGTEQAQGGKKRGQQQVLFVRGISHSEATQTAEGACARAGVDDEDACVYTHTRNTRGGLHVCVPAQHP